MIVDQPMVLRHRSFQNRLQGFAGSEHLLVRATFGKLKHPFEQSRVPRWFDAKRSRRIEQRFDRSLESTRFSQRQRVAGADVSAVGLRTRRSDFASFDNRDFKPSFSEIVCTRNPNHSAANNRNRRPGVAHDCSPVTTPQPNGSPG